MARSAYSIRTLPITGETIVLHRIGALNTGSTCHHDEELDTSRLARLGGRMLIIIIILCTASGLTVGPGADALNGARLMRRLTRLLAAAGLRLDRGLALSLSPSCEAARPLTVTTGNTHGLHDKKQMSAPPSRRCSTLRDGR